MSNAWWSATSSCGYLAHCWADTYSVLRAAPISLGLLETGGIELVESTRSVIQTLRGLLDEGESAMAANR